MEEATMEDDLPTEYDVVVVGTGIDFYHNGTDDRASRSPAKISLFAGNLSLS